MLALFALFFIVVLSMLIIKIVTLALVHTGVSMEVAKFQAASAFSGAGFTSGESESVPVCLTWREIIASVRWWLKRTIG